MPRTARKRSSTGVYHIMLRGLDKRNIFLDEEDKMKFMGKIMLAKERGKFELYGYCLMDNHVHLLLKENNEDIGTSIKRITVGYVGWHNNKYGRAGHLFQNRYMSEPVETESYFLTVLRYIHQNPVKAGLVQKAEKYSWSSYQQYMLAYQGQPCFIDPQLATTYFPTIEKFTDYMNTSNEDECLEYLETPKYTDMSLKTILYKKFNIENLEELPIEERNKKIKEIYEKTGVSIRQLARVLGLGKAVVEKAIK
ncbi:MAG: transposase [Firmicutes bacterium]|nr:transposase [Bacillota bacterium]